MDEFREERRRNSDLGTRLIRGGSAFDPGSRAVLGQVYNAGSMPTSLPGQFAVHPVRTSGPESEGGTYSATVDTSHTMIFTVVGNIVPGVGDILIGRLIEGRWVAERYTGDTTDTVVIAGCPCNGVIAGTVPVTLNVVATYGDGTYLLFYSSDLVYRTAPTWATPFGADASGNVHWSSAPYATDAHGPHYYALSCLLGAYILWETGPDIVMPGIGGGVGLRAFTIGIGGNRCHKPGQTFRLQYGGAPGGGTGGYPFDVIKILE